MLALALLAACALPAALAAVECPAGTYFHTHGSVDCAPGATCAGTVESCCCSCHANYYCPGGKTRQPEDPCPAGSTSPPNSTSAAACTGGPPPPPSGAFSQIHVAYTGRAEELSVDFVGGAGQTFVWTSLARAAGWTRAPATSFAHPTIGYMSAGLLRFAGVQPDAPAYYMVGDASANSSVYEVTPTIAARPEVFAVYADFGFANDVCMADLVSEAAKGGFDSVLHAGDWACVWRHGARAPFPSPAPTRCLFFTFFVPLCTSPQLQYGGLQFARGQQLHGGDSALCLRQARHARRGEPR